MDTGLLTQFLARDVQNTVSISILGHLYSIKLFWVSSVSPDKRQNITEVPDSALQGSLWFAAQKFVI